MALLLCKLKYSALGGMKTGITGESPLKLWGTLHGDMAQSKIRPRQRISEITANRKHDIQVAFFSRGKPLEFIGPIPATLNMFYAAVHSRRGLNAGLRRLAI
jgi:hypothetical protein